MRALFIIPLLLFLSSCIYNHTAVTEDLGNGYFFIGDGRESQILFNLNHKQGESNGRIVTEPEVLEYDFNSKYIIAKSKRDKNELYWIIDKELPLESLEYMTKNKFDTEMREKEIKLKLKKRK